MTMTNAFQLLTSFDVDYAPANIKKWRSSRTGLQLTFIKQASPIVTANIVVATEIEDSSGCPHTLEHLIFCGSKRYPREGCLRELSQRLVSTSRAITDTDKTMYELKSAAWNCFQYSLPIFIDHIFNPKITENSFETEVYRVDKEGNEGGTVFSEMQFHESDLYSILENESKRQFYTSESGYSSETGGLLSALRVLTVEKIRDFHKAMYRPDNVGIIISGNLEGDEVLRLVTSIDNELPPLPVVPNKRQWVDKPHLAPREKSLIKEVLIPDDDESVGGMNIGWIGPAISDTLSSLAIELAGLYLAESSTSVLNRGLVEIDEPLASYIEIIFYEFQDIKHGFYLEGIPVKSLGMVDGKIKSLLIEHTNEDCFELEQMRGVIARHKEKHIFQTEQSPDKLAKTAMVEALYGEPDGSSLRDWTKDLKEEDILMGWSTSQWCNFIKEYFVLRKSVTITGRPNQQLKAKIESEAEQRRQELSSSLEKRVFHGMSKSPEILKLDNDDSAAVDLFADAPKVKAGDINFIKTTSYTAAINRSSSKTRTEGDAFSRLIQLDTPADHPIEIHFEDYSSKYVTAILTFSLGNLSVDSLAHTSYFTDLFSLPIEEANEFLSVEKVTAGLSRDLVEYGIDFGFDHELSEVLTVTAKFEVQKYEAAVNWLLKTLKYSVFEKTRLQGLIEKGITTASVRKKDAQFMMNSIKNRTVFDSSSICKALDPIHLETYYKEVLKKVENGSFESVSQDIDRVRKTLFNTENMKLFLEGGCSNLAHPVSTWTEFANAFRTENEASTSEWNLEYSSQLKTSVGKACSESGYIVSMSASETTELISITPIPADHTDDSISRIIFACATMSAYEGALWKAVRGDGLAYDAWIEVNFESGFLTARLLRASNPQKAWTVCKKVVDEFVSGTISVDQMTLQSGLTGIVNALLQERPNPQAAAIKKMSDIFFKNRGGDFERTLLKAASLLTPADVVDTLKTYFVPLFDPKHSLVFAGVPQSSTRSMSDFLESQGYRIHIERASGDDEEERSKSEKPDLL